MSHQPRSRRARLQWLKAPPFTGIFSLSFIARQALKTRQFPIPVLFRQLAR